MKVVLVGDEQVGKTCMISYLITSHFQSTTSPTIGAAFQTYLVATSRGPITMQIWDTAGQEKYRALTPLYYRSADIAILVYDVTQIPSFNGLEKWVHELAEKAPSNLQIVVVGNKTDLADAREVNTEAARVWAERNGAKLYAEVSAKSGDGIVDFFRQVGEMLSGGKSKDASIAAGKAETKASEGETPGGCC
jgi:small GTP-binding protein